MKKLIALVVVGIFAGGAFIGYNVHQQVNHKYINVNEYVVESRTDEMIDNLQPRMDPSIRKMIAAEIDTACIEYNLDPELVVALINRESAGWKPWSVSYKDGKPCAYGLMQIHYKVHDDINSKYTINQVCEIKTNIHEGCRILRRCLDTHNGDVDRALGSYVNSQKFDTYKRDVLSTAARLYAQR